MGLSSQPETPPAEQPLNLEPRRTATNFSVRPVPATWGTHVRAGTHLDAIFDYETEAIVRRVKTGKSSSENVRQGTNYYGSIAQCVGFGPMTRLLAVIKDGKRVWSGDLDTTTSPFFSLTLESENVPMVIYTGTQDLGTVRGGGLTDQALPGGHPTYKGEIFFVFEKLFFGTVPSPPNFELIYEVTHRALVLDPGNTTGDPEQDDIGLHIVDRGQLVPEIIYSALTNPIFGGNMEASDFDLPSWISSCNTLRGEGFGYSAQLEKKTVTDSWIKRLLNFANAEINTINGQLVFTLKRAGDAITSIPESAFLRDPIVKPGSWHDSGIVNEVRVPYRLLGRDLEPLNTVQSDDSSRGIVGLRSKSFQFDGIRSELTATTIANRYVKAMGFPTVKYSLELDRTMRGILKGSLITPIFPARGLDGATVLRVLSVTRSAPGKGGIKIEAIVDKSHLENASQGATDDEVIFSNPDPQEISGHILQIPDELKESYEDGMIIPMSRTSSADDRAAVSFGWDGTTYDAISATGAFPLQINLTGWRDFGGGTFTADFSFSHPHEETAFLNSITDTLPEWSLVTKSSTSSALESSFCSIKAGTALQASGGGAYTVTFESAKFGTGIFSKSGAGPSAIAYLGPVGGFTFYRSNQNRIFVDEGNAPSDTGKVRRIVIQSATRGNTQDFADAFNITYDRPSQTLTPTWGGAVPHAFDYGISVTNDSGIAPLTFEVTITGTEAFAYSADWGDGGALEAGSGAPGSTISHVYTNVGTYAMTLTVTPSAGGVGQEFAHTITAT